jgi:hypothetical protein
MDDSRVPLSSKNEYVKQATITAPTEGSDKENCEQEKKRSAYGKIHYLTNHPSVNTYVG